MTGDGVLSESRYEDLDEYEAFAVENFLIGCEFVPVYDEEETK